MRARPLHLAALLLALLGLAAYLTVPAALGRAHDAARDRAHRAIAALPNPAGAAARAPGACPGAERCLRAAADPDAVTAELVASLRAAGLAPVADCQSGQSLLDVPLRYCVVRAGTGRGHAVSAVVETEMVAKGTRAGGSLVRVYAE